MYPPISLIIIQHTSAHFSSVLCEDGMYRSESMEDCEECTNGKETNAEKSECGMWHSFCLIKYDIFDEGYKIWTGLNE